MDFLPVIYWLSLRKFGEKSFVYKELLKRNENKTGLLPYMLDIILWHIFTILLEIIHEQ